MAATKGADPAIAAGNGAAKKRNGSNGGFKPTIKPIDAGIVIDSLKLSDEQLLDIYQEMLNVRHFEEACNRAFRAGKVGGYLHLYIGQEAISSGVLHALKPGDQVLSSYRDHAHCLVLGSEPGRVMAEIFGKATGLARGKGGSMHLFDKEHGFAGGYGIVGGNVPLATGIGWALKYNKTDNVCVCYIGDGAMNAGAFHESINMASLYHLPVLYIIENNGYAMGTSIERSHANPDLGSRFDSYAIKHVKVDGQDYFSVRDASQRAVDAMRKDPYPFCIETITYRYVGHGAADGAETQKTYREEAEVEAWKKRDPLIMLASVLEARGILDDSKKETMDNQALDFAKSASQYADASPWCKPEELYEDVYVA